MASPYYFDQALADAAVDFFPRFLRLTLGEWQASPFHLRPWQAHHTRQIFGWRRRSDGMRRYRRVRGFVPKKNGKTEWFAGIGHLLMVADNEPGAEVFSYATDKAQASIIFQRAMNMVVLDVASNGVRGPLASLYENPKSKSSLFCPHLMAAFKPMSGDPTGKHGPAAHGALGDEAHEWRDGTLHSFLTGGMANRRQPLDAIFTTAGRVKTYAHDLYLDAKAILEDPALDPECYVFIYEAAADADWTDPEVWAQANPNIGISVKREFLESQCREALRSPRLENDFKRYHLGLWTEQLTRWLPMHRWAENTRAPDDQKLWQSLAAEMHGRPAFAGIDLGSTDDMSAVVWVFPPQAKGERWTLVPRFWVPAGNVPDRDKPGRPYRKWIAEGALLTTPGNVTDYDFVEQEIMSDAERFICGAAAIDRLFQAAQVSVHLQNEGLPVVGFGQGFYSMTAPTMEFERLFISGQFEHGNHPVLRWMFGNAAIAQGPAGIKPDKAKAAEKIDGLVAAIMGLAMAIGRKPEQSIDDFLTSPVIIG